MSLCNYGPGVRRAIVVMRAKGTEAARRPGHAGAQITAAQLCFGLPASNAGGLQDRCRMWHTQCGSTYGND